MAVAMSPWPSSPVALTAATECLATALGEDDAATVQRLGSVAAELVQRYAPDAPAPVKNEAVIRCAGWLAGQPAAAIRSEKVGELGVDYVPSMLSALRHSGGQALLSGWKIRRGGSIG